jgi:tetratricopeptide (TPR) repeat protein
VNLNDPLAITYPYEWVYEGVLNRVTAPGQPIRGFVLGGGGFTFPHYLEVARPKSYVEVAEIDPAVTEAAHAAFGFPRDTSVVVYNMDARNRVEDILAANDANARFDYVFGDSINDYSVPYHLTTREFAQKVHTILKPGGVYMLNLIDVFDSGRFLAAAVGACQAAFEHVQVFSTMGTPNRRETFVVVSSDAQLDLSAVPDEIRKSNTYAGRLLEPSEIEALLDRTGRVLLTDNYAPVENLLAPVAGTRNGGPAEIRYDLARRYAARDWYRRSEVQARKALELYPDWEQALAILAWDQFMQKDADGARATLAKVSTNGGDIVAPWVRLGETRVRQGDVTEGAAMLAAAVGLEPSHVEARTRLGDVALQMGRGDLAIGHWTLALAGNPNNAEVLRKLGAACAAQQQYDQAIGYWRRALAIEPKDAGTTHNLIAALVVLGRVAEAADAIRAADQAALPVDDALRKRVQSTAGN